MTVALAEMMVVEAGIGAFNISPRWSDEVDTSRMTAC